MTVTTISERIAVVTIPDNYESLLERPLYGHLEIVPSPTGASYLELNDQYHGPADKADHVILVVCPTAFSKQ